MRVLLVEDNQEVRRRLRGLLSGLPGIQLVGEATGVRQTLEKLPECAPQLMILDLQLEDGDGFEVLAYLQRQITPPKVVVLTNYADEVFRRRCEQLGALCLLDKSKDLRRLREFVTTLTESPLDGR